MKNKIVAMSAWAALSACGGGSAGAGPANWKLAWSDEFDTDGVPTFAKAKDGDNSKWPFSNPQYLILNLAIGGMLAGPVDDAIFPVRPGMVCFPPAEPAPAMPGDLIHCGSLF